MLIYIQVVEMKKLSLETEQRLLLLCLQFVATWMPEEITTFYGLYISSPDLCFCFEVLSFIAKIQSVRYCHLLANYSRIKCQVSFINFFLL